MLLWSCNILCTMGGQTIGSITFKRRLQNIAFNFNCFEIFPNHTLIDTIRSGTNSKIIFKSGYFKQKEFLEQGSVSQDRSQHIGVVGKSDLLS